MDNQWIAKSLTVWGLIIAVVTAMLPAVTALFPALADTITPEWIAGIDASVKSAITGMGVLIGAVMVIADRVTGNAAKTLVLRRSDAE